ncbi:lactate racemase domain-containing protein [Stratiformator vulcanicus]|nr:lactate racemase domain-containing protein [Stratiformator vulcanicus]
MLPVRQIFDAQSVEDVTAATHDTLNKAEVAKSVRPGESVAITVGSRGIANLKALVRAQIEFFQAAGAKPFIVPAMGSHGGGNSEGQRALLAGFDLTEESLGVEICSTMETVILGRTDEGIEIHFAKPAFEADHVIVFNRVKPHTDFAGPIESGLHKMLMIGLGKRSGAEIYHRHCRGESFEPIASKIVPLLLEKCPVLCGLAVVENAREETAHVEAVRPESFASREPELLQMARKWMPRLPVNEVDLLIIDQFGKEISGTGMDMNVVGRKFLRHFPSDRESVRCKRIFVRSVTVKSKGNGCGIGYADFTNDRTVAAIDREITGINCVTSGHVSGAHIPVSFPTDRECIETALRTIGPTPPQEARVVRILDTLHLESVEVSESCLPDIAANPQSEPSGPVRSFQFDSDGNLTRLSDQHSG